ncbi:MAG: ATP synthase subunit I [Burkholderiales bacterium]
MRWQLIAAAAGALVAGGLGGVHAALSALLGGLAPWVAGLGYTLMVSRAQRNAPGAITDTLRTMIRAEGFKILLIVFQCWLVFTVYRDIVMPAFFVSFVAGIVIFAMAVAVRDRPVSRR